MEKTGEIMARIEERVEEGTMIEHPTFYESLHPQRSREWDEERKGIVSASNFGRAADLCEIGSSEEYLNEIRGVKEQSPILPERERLIREKTIDEDRIASERRMNYGVIKEDVARNLYCQKLGVECKEMGFCIPKWDLEIGCSPDGAIDTGHIIEIKCPERPYRDIVQYHEDLKRGITRSKNYTRHIKESHYCQIQGQLAILDAEICDYVVYHDDLPEKILVTRVHRNRSFWSDVLYPRLRTFISEIQY